MPSKNGSQGFVEVILGAGTLSPTIGILPLAEAREEDGSLKPDHELVRLGYLLLKERHPPTACLERWHVYLKALAQSLPEAVKIESRLPWQDFDPNPI